MIFDRTTVATLARWTASGLTALLLLTGCGSKPGGGEAPPNNQPGTSKTGTTSSSGSQGNVQPSDVGISTGKHPDGLFQSIGDGGDSCSGVNVPAGRHVTEPFEMERLQTIVVCFLAFAHTPEPIEIELTGPDAGDRVVEKTSSSLPGGWVVNARGDMKRGTYRYRAAPKLDGASSSSQVTGVIRVVSARKPRVRQISDTDIGRRFQIALAGYPAGSRVQVFLYGPERNDGFPFARALPQAIVGPDGEAMYSWQAGGDDPPGYFTLWFNPGCYGKYPCIW